MQITDAMVEAAVAQLMQYGVNAPESTIYAASRAALTAALAKAWRPVSEAKKDGVPLLVRFRDDLRSLSGRRRAGKCAVMVWAGRDGGEWHYHGPIGMGGFPDEWIAGWMPLPAPPATKEAGEQ